MDLVRFGSDIRLLRRTRGWTQARLAKEAGVSRWMVSEVECGRGARMPAERLFRIASALGGFVTVRLTYRGEALDRLRDRRHASLVDRLVHRLRAAGWEIATEVSFNVFGERGSIDILAFHPDARALVVIEVKTVVPDLGGMLATLDRKVRLAGEIARARGWHPVSVSRLLVLPDERTARRRVGDHAATFAVGFPERNVKIDRWLASPSGAISGLLFLPSAAGSRTRHGTHRVASGRSVA